MLANQTAFYFLANTFSAVFGLVNVVVLTRLFAADAFGDYLLGFAFATIFATIPSSSIKFAIMSQQARGDGTDIRRSALAALILSGFTLPIGYGAARLAGLSPEVSLVSLGLTIAVVVYDTSQELLRAEQKAASYMRGTIVRAVLVSVLGIAFTLFGKTGAMLLASSSIGYLLATTSFWRKAWGLARPSFEATRLLEIVITGFPLTISLTLLSLSAMIDRFMLAAIAGKDAAGQFGAGLDLVRQSLIIPAISIATAFVPVAVRLLATRGAPDARAHLERYLEILVAATLPACVGLAILAPQVADLVLGPSFRQAAHEAMPVFAAALLFQILTQQYFHISFLLSNRTVFYLANTGSIIAWNLVASYLLIHNFGMIGAAWGRLATEVFGTLSAVLLSRFAFPMPFPLLRLARIGAATAAMGLVVLVLEDAAAGYGPIALIGLVPAGVAVYAATAWLMDVGGVRALLSAFARNLARSADPPRRRPADRSETELARKPTFFILGAPKCGTTSLGQWLAGHPNIFMSPEKEPHFFNTDDRQFITTLNSYEDLFQGACDRHSAIGEASVWYLSSSEAVENILRYQPEARFIIMLRNPVEMAPALHAEMALAGHESVLEFGSAWALQAERRLGRRLPALCWSNRRLQYGDICSLGAQLQRLFLLVSRSRVLPVVLDDVVDCPRREYLRVLEFLGVSDDGRSYFPILNKARIARWPRLNRIQFIIMELKGRAGIKFSLNLNLSRRMWAANIVEAPRTPLSPEFKGALQEYFASDVELLGRLLNRDLGHWLESTPNPGALPATRHPSANMRRARWLPRRRLA